MFELMSNDDELGKSVKSSHLSYPNDSLSKSISPFKKSKSVSKVINKNGELPKYLLSTPLSA